MTSDGLEGVTIEYNSLNLPRKVSSSATVKANYCYLADGTKVSALTAGGTGLVYRGPFTYRRSSAGALTLESAACEEGRLTPSGAMLHVTDHIGSVVAVVRGSDGALYEASEYDACGKRSSLTNAGTVSLPSGVTQRDRFTGKEDQDPDFAVGYTDFGARHYSPSLRRWLVPDPLSEKYYGISPYAYCAGDPVNIIDDGGLDLILLGANKSSVTFKTDLINKSVDISRLGIDWKGNYSFEGDELLSAALDVAGIFDPSGAADMANASLQYRSGDNLGAAISAAGVIPYVGDLAKTARIGKDVKIINSAIKEVSFNSRNFRKYLSKMTGINPKDMQAHHMLPQKFRQQFERAGINIDNPKYGRWLESSNHNKLSYKYNKEWETFFEQQKDATEKDILEHADFLMKKIYGE